MRFSLRMTVHTIYPLFSTPVYYSKIDFLSINHIEYITNLKYKRTPDSDGNMSIDKYVLNSPELKEIKSQVTNHINTYVYDVIKTTKDIKFKLLNSWAMQHSSKDYSPMHNHGNSLISGILYIKTSKNCGNIKFHSRIKDIFSETIRLQYEDYNLYNSPAWYFEPYDGLILLFPSHLDHEVLPNLSNDIRYCVAFNVFVTGDLAIPGDFSTNVLSLK